MNKRKRILMAFGLMVVTVGFWGCGNDAPGPTEIVTSLVITTVDEDGAPIPDVTVNLYKSVEEWIEESSPAVTAKITDELGQVTFEDLDSITYYIDAQKGFISNWEQGVIKPIVYGYENKSDITVMANQSGMISSAIGKKWFLDAYFLNGSDFYTFLDDCVKDDILFFFKGPGLGSFQINYGENRCSGNTLETADGTWKIKDTDNILEIVIPGNGSSWKIEELDSANLTVSFRNGGNNIEATYINIE